ncbi:hypothetical protein [uncultured Roseobacter sp.]|uniref:hypothetical protein n=1 Tax=uncultured Roseobacter sp. TaxID=114847 RepID=UPI002616470A|nr:hypothetical protein [uncultured Roseobacter sp.]
MANDVFYARLERIQQSQQQAMPTRSVPIRQMSATMPGASPAGMISQRQHPVFAHLKALFIGTVLGVIAAIALIGLSWEGSPWAAGTGYHDYVFWPAMAGLAMGGVLILISLVVASRRPAFALFSLGYLSGLIISLIV